MAKEIDKILSKISSDRTAKVKEIRDLEAKLRPANLSDSERKSINSRLNKLREERAALDEEGNKLAKVSKDAEEYVKLNKEVAELDKSIAKAEARGEDTGYLEGKRTTAASRIDAIAPAVEKSFPDLAKQRTTPKIGKAPTSGVVKGFTPPTTETGLPPAATAPVPTPTPTPTPTPGKTPGPKPDKKPKPDKNAPEKLTIDQIIDKVAQNYGAIDSIFKTDPDLQALLRKAIGKDGTPNTDDDLTPGQFVKELENTNWFKENAGPLRQRGFYKRQFDDLLKGGAVEDELLQTSEYGRGLTNTKQIIEDEAVRLGIVLDETDLDLIARDIYDLGNETKPAIIQQRIRSKIAYKPGKTLSGVAGENLADLRKVAAANGLDLEKNFGSSLQGWLQKLAQGESIETYKQIVRNAAKLGLPDKVASLIDQGVDLDTIYKPYKDIMAAVLEVNPATITVNDKVLRSAIGPEREMSLYDFQKMLRKDDRWQYTNQAKEEVSGVALNVLRDFGFQG
jgi:hypothetical protein